MESFGSIMFTDAVRARQRGIGSEETYARIAARPVSDHLGEDERAFIESRDSFYLATVNSDGWPYVQHRGGPAGFLKVLGPTRIGFADYRGNRQLVTGGNLDGDDRVSIFLMDYPRRARLKLLGRARMIATDQEPALTEVLVEENSPAERLVVIDITAFDWNCPKYITPRFTEAEIETMLGPRLRELADENARLKTALAEKEP